MESITDSDGTEVPVTKVKCVPGGVYLKPHHSKLFGVIPDGPYHFPFETVDGVEHWSKDYPNHKAAYADMKALQSQVSELRTAREHGKTE